ncbi:hypothetical protein NO1_0487 [Candidatus Termititenax aidoneus]|uniref:EF-hand domain-containing protein n=1 Tax=Termititenax aidoneus TaxID=2218524 RepID=A0A388T8U4_TERA1|nr:hypothetical protein NO1_0487 [Candidatus Termititenax aidoneus]
MSINLNSLFHKYDGPGWFNLKNNKLNQREFANLQRDNPEFKSQKFADFDADRDGQISPAEFHYTLAYKSQLNIDKKELRKFDFINIYLPQELNGKDSFVQLLKEAQTYYPGEEASLAVFEQADKKLLAEIARDRRAMLSIIYLLHNPSSVMTDKIRAKFNELYIQIPPQDAESTNELWKAFCGNTTYSDMRFMLSNADLKEDFLHLLNFSRQPMPGLAYLFFREFYSAEDLARLPVTDGEKTALETLRQECQNLTVPNLNPPPPAKPAPITYLERFANAAELQKIVDFRRQPLDPDQKTALVIFNKDDPNGAFGNNDISELIANGYQVCYYEVESDQELENIFANTYNCNTLNGDKQHPIDLVYLGGHGLPTGISFSLGNITADSENLNLTQLANSLAERLSLPPFSEEEIQQLYFNEANPKLLAKLNTFVQQLDAKMLDTTDNAEMQKCSRYCAAGGSVVAFACLNGLGKENTPSMSNSIARTFTEQTVYASTIIARSQNCRMLFDENQNFSGMRYSDNPEDTYVVQNSNLPPILKPENAAAHILDAEAAAQCVLYMSSTAILEKLGLKISAKVDEKNPNNLIHIEYAKQAQAIHNPNTPEQKLEDRGYFNLGGPLVDHIDIVEQPDGSVIIREISKIFGLQLSEIQVFYSAP